MGATSGISPFLKKNTKLHDGSLGLDNNNNISIDKKCVTPLAN